MAQCHRSLPRNTEDNVFLHILVTQRECLFTHAPSPPTPTETELDSEMDVEESEPDPEGAVLVIPDGASQIRFLQRHNASRLEDTVTQSDLPWAGHVE